MSRRRNNIQGPTSALTDFLRESGITAASIARRVATRNQPGGLTEGTEAEAGPSTAQQEEPPQVQASAPGPGPSTSRKRTRSKAAAEADDDYNSDHLDEEGEAEGEGPSKKPKLSKAAGAKAKAKAKTKAKARAKKDDEDYNGSTDEDEDAYTALSRSMLKRTGAGGGRPPNGSFEKCARCSNQFTVTQYTMAAKPGPGYLCHKCAKESGTDPFKKPTAPRKRKAPAKSATAELDVKRVPTLASLCVKVISEHINNVEALGDMGTVNMDNIIRSLSRHRTLTPENATLFYSVRNKELTLYDTTELPPPALKTLAMLNPNLTSLRLDFCGRMDNSVIAEWSSSLPSLVHLDLLGPFLVRAEAWIGFLKSHPHLESFRILQSPRFNLDCIQTLAESCTGLRSLRLKEVGLLSDGFLEHIAKLKQLVSLDLSDPAQSCSEAALSTLVKQLSPRLEELDLSGHIELTDAFLFDALESGCSNLTHLELSNLPELTDVGVARMFQTWRDSQKGPALTSLVLARNAELGERALTAVLACTGLSLTHLDINGWRTTPADTLAAIGQRARDVRKLDVGWNREVNDLVVKAIIDGCQRVEEIKCWGCNRITMNCPRRRGVRILGVESHTSA